MNAVDPQGGQKYYTDGSPVEGVRFEPSQTGTQQYWFEGQPVVDMTPALNADTGKMFLVFE